MSDSATEPTLLSLDAAAHSWSLLSAQIDRFIQAWDLAASGESAAPEINDFLPPDASPVLIQELLLELVKVDLDYRWTRDHLPRRVEDYLGDFPGLADLVTPDVLFEECRLRKQAGESVDLEEHRKAFPRCAAELERLWKLENTSPQSGNGAHAVRRVLDRFVPGDAVDDFDLLTLLGSGAFARVFLARQRSMQRLVALKLSADKSREPQTLAQLDHDNIVRVFDQRSVPEVGLRLLYMQYVPGGTLQDVVPLVKATPGHERTGALLVDAVRNALEKRGEVDRLATTWADATRRVPWSDIVCRIGMQLARALEYAHRAGVLHRDIKPANVLLAGDGSPRLADFNISFSASSLGSTPAAYFGGSLAYMSPEQLEAAHPGIDRSPDSLDGRSDLYSLGVLLYEVSRGQRPFTDESVVDNWTATLEQMIARRKGGPPEEAHSVTDTGSRALAQVLGRCLKADVGGRFQSGGELARHLEVCLDRPAWRLLNDVDQGWRGAVRRFPRLAAVMGVLLPNQAATAFNIFYNEAEIIVPLAATHAGVRELFWNTLTCVNAVAFPIGIAWALDRVRGVFPGVTGRGPSTPVIRRRALLSGVNAGGICLLLWFTAGFVYPIVLRHSGVAMTLSHQVHFLVSLTMCGLVSAVYPFFALTWVAVKVYYPSLVRLSDRTLPEDEVVLRSVKQWCEAGLMLAAAVPLLAVTLLVVTGSKAQLALMIAAAGGLFGFVLCFLAYRTLRDDLETLLRVIGKSSSGRIA
ncbi:Serine/threonine-protein kinase PknB [Caulifigura coniformis]|uniref:Serine/threonine-protein kinase PknB n=1 Tax=Caulifigura coniformis TaxID=2527983 RepID=A0A517S861_9PLAN|nr:serine/threonine-protein kinase [Caulifigura coniformis]QDT52314.1 Serine/threonine-protein kinase PknB [Caulifigura coniformis]